MLKPSHLAGGADIDLKLFFLKRPEPTMLPTPQLDFSSHDVVGLLQSQFTFQEGFGVVVVVKDSDVAVALKISRQGRKRSAIRTFRHKIRSSLTQFLEEPIGKGQGTLSVDFELNGGFWEYPEEELDCNPQGKKRNQNADCDQT